MCVRAKCVYYQFSRCSWGFPFSLSEQQVKSRMISTASIRFGFFLWLADKSSAYYPSHSIGRPWPRLLHGHCAGLVIWLIYMQVSLSEINGLKNIKLIFLLLVIRSIRVALYSGLRPLNGSKNQMSVILDEGPQKKKK